MLIFSFLIFAFERKKNLLGKSEIKLNESKNDRFDE